MAVTIRTAITYDKSRNENSGHTDVEKVSIRRWRDDCIITLQGSGRLGKTELRLPPALARAVAHSILTVSEAETPAETVSFGV